MNNHRFIVEEIDNKLRIDKFLSVKLKDFTRSRIQKLCENGHVIVNENAVNKNYLLTAGDSVVLHAPINDFVEILPEKINFLVHFKDEFLAVIEKPKGLLIYPTDTVKSGTLVNGLVNEFGDNLSNLAGNLRPGVVHRIDKDTSGLLIIAFDNLTHEKLNIQMLDHKVDRAYQGIVYGKPKEDHGIIEHPIGRNPSNRTKMAVVSNGRYAKTEYRVLNQYPHFSLVEFELYTGRTHQIRVHSAFIGNPLVGDAIYGPKKVITELNGQCLHAYKIEFIHPRTGKNLSIETNLPDYFTKFIKKIDV